MVARRTLLVPAGLLALLFLALSSNAIVSAKMYELRLRVQRDQIFNYRLSSDLMRSKILSLIPHRESYKDELWNTIAESSILRTPASIESGTLSVWQRIGLPIVNTARRLCLKAGIDLRDDATILSRIQRAFFLERNSMYGAALKEYEPIEEIVSGDERTFVILHAGFCLAVLGRNAEAVSKLERVGREAPGSIFDEDAQLILRLLRSGDLKHKQILRTLNDPLERARALFDEGLYAEALKHWEEGVNLTNLDRYRRAYSLEKTGNSEAATEEFLHLSQGTDEAAIKANRRLLLIGFLYSGGKDLQDFATRNSSRLGDSNTAAEVQGASARALVFQAADNGDPPALIVQRQNRLTETISKRLIRIPAPVQITLVDGRVFTGIEVSRKFDQITLWLTHGTRLALPAALIDSVSVIAPGDRLVFPNASNTKPIVRLKGHQGNFHWVYADSTAAALPDEFEVRAVREVFQ